MPNLVFLVLIFSAHLCAMEQSTVMPVVQERVPSLKMLALKTYAQVLNDAAPKEDLSDEEMVMWCEEWDVNCFFDCDTGSLTKQLMELCSPQSIRTNLKCPKIFAHDTDYGLLDDWEKGAQYIVQIDGSRCAQLPLGLFAGSAEYGEWPVFSPGARWLVGWEKENRSALVLVQLSFDAQQKLDIKTSRTCFRMDWFRVDHAFYDEETILLRTASEIFMAAIADFAQQGMTALKKIYARNDHEEYPEPFRYRTMHVLSDSLIACVGPGEDTIEMLKRDKDTWSLSNVLAIEKIHHGHFIVHAARGIAASLHKSIWLYQLVGDDAGKKSEIKVKCFQEYGCVFSPRGEYLACGTNFNRQVIEIFDCRNLASPLRLAIIPNVVQMGPADCGAWTINGLIARDGWGKQHNIEFNRTALLVERYAAYRKKKEKVSNNNNA